MNSQRMYNFTIVIEPVSLLSMARNDSTTWTRWMKIVIDPCVWMSFILHCILLWRHSLVASLSPRPHLYHLRVCRHHFTRMIYRRRRLRRRRHYWIDCVLCVISISLLVPSVVVSSMIWHMTLDHLSISVEFYFHPSDENDTEWNGLQPKDT